MKPVRSSGVSHEEASYLPIMNDPTTLQSGYRPKISIVVPSYNHASYLPITLQSVLSQTYHDYEIIICDDASTDNSISIIESFIQSTKEKAITFIKHDHNQGGAATLNDLIGLAKGEYIAVINSDDFWLPEKLEKQIPILQDNPGVAAVFTQAEMIDEKGNILRGLAEINVDRFKQKNRTQGEWLSTLFFDLNCLCHPSILIRRSTYQYCGLYDVRLHQLPDMDMWVRVLKHADIKIVEEPLTSYRVHRETTSSLNRESTKRNLNELFLVLRTYFEQMPDNLFLQGFRKHLRAPDALGAEVLKIEKAFIYFQSSNFARSIYEHIGIEALFSLLKGEPTRQILHTQYHFTECNFTQLTGKYFFDERLLGLPTLLGGVSLQNKASESLGQGEGFYSERMWWEMNRQYLTSRLRKNRVLRILASRFLANHRKNKL